MTKGIAAPNGPKSFPAAPVVILLVVAVGLGLVLGPLLVLPVLVVAAGILAGSGHPKVRAGLFGIGVVMAIVLVAVAATTDTSTLHHGPEVRKLVQP
ncbi:hypothetical protein [Patulibacter defluvii]|uniref:hypothetical protein n=1 Tax=Patulibacter defluvii TaxID=3095358 RepID=UPI002A74B7CE|nr:hypothetical protein [Patulibacter sp. DM4]